ncbi:MAG: hypothetical protein AAFP69_08555, partial [Planctomycetota bacterium]
MHALRFTFALALIGLTTTLADADSPIYSLDKLQAHPMRASAKVNRKACITQFMILWECEEEREGC